MAKPNPDDAKRWSQHVTATSQALDLEPGVFSWDDPNRIARSLKASADHSQRRKTTPFASAMAMLNFYINRAGRKLPDERKQVLQAAKDELRRVYGKGGDVAASGGWLLRSLQESVSDRGFLG